MCNLTIIRKQAYLTKSELENMWSYNHDGGGIATYDNMGRVVFTKGLMTCEDLWRKYNEYKKYNNDIVIHTRYGTSGSARDTRIYTHPFVVSNDYGKLFKLSGEASALLFHNGVFSINIEGILSDTQTFVKKVIYPLWKENKRFLDDEEIKDDIENEIIGSRVVFMDKNGIEILGSGWTEIRDGFITSNTYWMPTNSYSYTKYNSYKNNTSRYVTNKGNVYTFEGLDNYKYATSVDDNDSYYGYYDDDDDYFTDEYYRAKMRRIRERELEEDVMSMMLWNDKRRAQRFATNKGEKHRSYIDILQSQCI